MSLLYDVLRSRTPDSLDKRSGIRHNIEREDSDDELINVVSIIDIWDKFCQDASKVSVPGTPHHSHTQSRATTPTRGLSSRSIQGTTGLPNSRRSSKDPLRLLPTELLQRVFGYLSVSELANCALVSRKWSKSQTINYGLL